MEDAFLDKAITVISHVCDSTDAFAWGPQEAVKSKKKSQKKRSRAGAGTGAGAGIKVEVERV